MKDHTSPITSAMQQRSKPKRIMVLGATGTIGQNVARALVKRDHQAVCFVRPRSGVGGAFTPDDVAQLLPGAIVRVGDATDPQSLEKGGFGGERFDALVSCLASRTGAPQDAWRIDYKASADALAVAQKAGISHMTLLSAICVQKPTLEFQKAKLAFENELIASGIDYSIVRPTAFFKSLSGQVERVRQGKSYLIFGDGMLTACKPISDADLGHYIADCVDDEHRHNKILPIGGPGNAITPKEQGEFLFEQFGRKPRFKKVPPAMLQVIAGLLSAAGQLYPPLMAKSEMARIGHYYATESMLVLNPETGRYSADLTPSTGAETLFDYYKQLISGEITLERGDHAVF